MKENMDREPNREFDSETERKGYGSGEKKDFESTPQQERSGETAPQWEKGEDHERYAHDPFKGEQKTPPTEDTERGAARG